MFMKAKKKLWLPDAPFAGIIVPLGNRFAYAPNDITTAATGTNGDTTPWTATGINIGPAFATRRVIVIAYGGAGNTLVASATINGIAASTPLTGGSNAPFSIYSALVPTGTTATIVQTMTGAFFGASGIQVYVVDDASLTSPVPVAHFSDSSSGSIPGSVAVLADGFLITAVAFDSGSDKHPAGFSVSSPSLTTDLSDGRNLILGSANNIAAGTATATATWTTSANATMMMAAFK